VPELVDVRRGAYYDSVTLMQVSRGVAGTPGVTAAQVAMGTELNLDVLRGMGFRLPDGIGTNDVVVALKADDEEGIERGRVAVDEALAALSRTKPSTGFGAAPPPVTLAGAIAAGEADLGLISVPGDHATAEAIDAIEAGISVMLFSDNVAVADEVALKDAAAERGVLVMGPDCGTAVVSGVALGFANVVRPGSVGLVAASGTGAQQVMCLLDAAGIGVSHCLGVGGRDLSSAVGGRSTKQALAILDADEATEAILIVSKPPAPEVLAEVQAYAARLGTPVHWATLGAGRPDLTASVEAFLAASGHARPEWPHWAPQPDHAAHVVEQPDLERTEPGLRGLFCGGTLADEAMLIATEVLGPIRSNIPLSRELGLDETMRHAGHVVIDFGDDGLTQGRAHPMIDPSLRLERIHDEGADPSCGVLLLDLVLGHGAHPDPAHDLAEAIRYTRVRAGADGRDLPVVVSLVGTEGDPQGLEACATALAAAGADVYLSNAAATRAALAALGVEVEAPIVAPVAAPTAREVARSQPEPGGSPGASSGSLPEDPAVATVGVSLFADALREQAVRVTEAQWQPPLAGADPGDLRRVLTDARRAEANAEALRRMLAAEAVLVDVRPAHEALGLERGTFLHAGPPLEWERASGPMKGALIGAMLFEGMAQSPEEAEQKLASGDGIRLEPCHHRDAVGPMAGVVSPSMWMYELRDEVHRNTSWCSLNEGLGKVLRYGAYGPEVIDRLRWMNSVLGPLLQQAARRAGGIDVKAIVAQMLQMGDEGHNRNRAGSLMLLRELTPHLITAQGNSSDIAEAVRFSGANEHFFLNLGMPACKLATMAAHGIPGSTIVTTMARNGTDFGIRVSGTGDQWFTGPANTPQGLFLGDYGPEDANPDIGDSAITETAGIGGVAMAAAPAIVKFVGGDVPFALEATQKMYAITQGEHSTYQVPILDFRGTPTGIDVTKVVRTGILPQINTGMAGRVAGVGQVGAGLVNPPEQCFTQALSALAAAVPR
jgi:succinyl-CoA synthetase alpha subunit